MKIVYKTSTGKPLNFGSIQIPSECAKDVAQGISKGVDPFILRFDGNKVVVIALKWHIGDEVYLATLEDV